MVFLCGHILEHNFEWEKVLHNALASFRRRMVLVLFTPFVDKTHPLKISRLPGSEQGVPDMAFARDDIIRHFAGLTWTSEEGLVTDSQYKIEHIFYLGKAGCFP